MGDKRRENKSREFAKSYEDFADAIFRHCFFRVSNREIALDLTQETFTKTWDYIFAGKEIDDIRSFLYKVAGNLIIDYYRKKKSTSLDLLQEDGFDLRDDDHEKIRDFSEGQEILRVVEKLDDGHKTVIIMRFVEGFTPKEIANVLDVTENVVSVRINRGLKKIREILKVNNER